MITSPANFQTCSCDGIRSRVRQCIAGRESPAAQPQYSHDYAYRALVPMDKVVEAVGTDVAMTRTMHVRGLHPPYKCAND